MISGVVSDKEGPMMLVNVTQRDSLDRIVARSITDREGKFTFPLLNPGNTIKVTYLGYEPVALPINKLYFEIKMKDLGDLPPVVIESDRVMETTGLPVPLSDVSSIVPTINMEEFEGLGITTVDEALDGVIPGLDIVFESGDLAYGPPVRSLMRMMDEVGDRKPLVALDFVKREIDKAKLESFDFENLYNDRDSLASLLGVKKSRLKAVRYLKNAKATAMWGRFGENGVIEVITPKTYRKYKKEGKLENDWQLLK